MHQNEIEGSIDIRDSSLVYGNLEEEEAKNDSHEYLLDDSNHQKAFGAVIGEDGAPQKSQELRAPIRGISSG